MVKRSSSVINTYLQLIYSLIESEVKVKAIKLSRAINSSPSTVHATLKRMQRDGLVIIDQKKEIILTDKGIDHVLSLIRNRRLCEQFLYEKLNIPLNDVRIHVAKMLEGLTPLIEEKLAKYLGNPKSCPHGKFIPPLTYKN